MANTRILCILGHSTGCCIDMICMTDMNYTMESGGVMKVRLLSRVLNLHSYFSVFYFGTKHLDCPGCYVHLTNSQLLNAKN